jgi:alkylglycerol monooxygenase
MERYGKILLIAIPIFVLCVALEKVYGLLKGQDKSHLMDTISSLYSGVTNIVKDILGLSISIFSYTWLLEHLAVKPLEVTLWTYIFLFLLLDFQGYWVHRWSHTINFFWNKHAIHHSSEEFNLACALRQSIASFVNLFTFFLVPAAFFGVPVEIVATLVPIHLFAQFWYHTQHIDKMGFLEKIIVTPSHHRVHHAINPEYLDKNYAPIFIFWDRWFGTFQEELADTPAVYGISVPVQTWNPIKINFQHLWLLAKDAYYTQNWFDKLRIWWMPTGWRPADMIARFPVQKINNVYSFEKYNPPASDLLKGWSSIQFLISLIFLTYFLGSIATFSANELICNGFFIFATIYSMTELMDNNPMAIESECFRGVLGFLMLYFNVFQFSNNQGLQILTIVYFLISIGMAYFLIRESKSQKFVKSL